MQAVEECFTQADPSAALSSFLGTNIAALKDLTALVRSDLKPLERKVGAPEAVQPHLAHEAHGQSSLSCGNYTVLRNAVILLQVLVALITIDVHNRDIVDFLVTSKVTTPGDFGWQMQLRWVQPGVRTVPCEK